MLKNYIKTTFRNLLRNKVNALINIFGLSMGLGCAIVLLLLADYHTSFDDFHTNKDRIFRVVSSSDGQGGQRDHTTGVPTPFPDAMRNDFPELEEVSFVTFKYGTTLVSVESYGQTKYFEEDEHIAIIDQHYLKLFDIEWLEGNKSTAMSEPNSIILSEDWVKKYFGDEPALNQTITMDKETVMVVKGVMANPPKQSDFPFHMYISLPTVKEEILSYGWGSVSSDDQCYILLSDVADTTRINAQLDEFTVKYFGEHNNNKKLALQPLSNLHSSDQYTNYNYSTTSKDNILTMRLVALFLVLTACVN
ncbi:MAG: ABC transporter permease, partial [Bacteroidota bacterium]